MLDKGIVIAGDIQVSLLDIELLTIKLRLLVASADKAKEMGIDWWQNDPFLKGGTATATSSRTGSAGSSRRPESSSVLRRVVIWARVEAAWYVYGVVPADARRPTGVERASSERRAARAIVGRVDLAEFGEEPLRRNLENRAWLEQAVAAHDGVLSGVVGAAPLVPFRFGTVFRDEDGVREMLREREDELREALDRLRGHVELGVKVFLVDAAPGEEAKPASGRDYLLQKQRARDAASTVQAEAFEQVRALHEHLASLADGARVNPPQPSRAQRQA